VLSNERIGGKRRAPRQHRGSGDYQQAFHPQEQPPGPRSTIRFFVSSQVVPYAAATLSELVKSRPNAYARSR
jgi:hypothetical protein